MERPDQSHLFVGNARAGERSLWRPTRNRAWCQVIISIRGSEHQAPHHSATFAAS